jgi:hypothetical protein
MKNYRQSITRLLVGKLDENGDLTDITCTATGCGFERNCFAEGYFNKGKYLILV